MKKLVFTLMTLLLPMLASADDSGICGDNLTWTYVEDTGTLSIEGSGIMTNCTYMGSPWYSHHDNIKKLILSNGVTSIGDYAFQSCYGLTSVIIPNSVTNIGEGVFSGCTGLSSVVFSNSMTFINQGSFENCSNLTSVNIPNSVDSIGGEAFRGCSSLTSVTIPKSVMSIGTHAFYKCTSLKKVIIEDLKSWCNIDFPQGQYCNPLDYAEYLYIGDNLVTDLVIPDDISVIKQYTFYNCKGIKSITFPNKLSIIEKSAFYGCNNMISVKFGSSIIRIDDRAFNDCSINKVVISDLANWCKSTFFDTPMNSSNIHLYLNEDEITNLIIPESSDSVSKRAFSQCSNIKSVTFHNQIKSIGSEAFYGCTGIQSIYLPNSVNRIGSYAFGECSNLKSINIPENLKSIEKGTFQRTGLESLAIPNSITSIGSSAFYGCKNLIDISLPNNLESIEGGTFTECTSLQNIKIPESVTSIGYQTFAYCYNITEITIPNNVISIGYMAFGGCWNVRRLVLGKSVKILGDNLFYSKKYSQKEIIALMEKPEIISENVFSYYERQNSTLYVPKGCIDNYLNTPCWWTFSNIQEYNPTPTKYVIIYYVDGEFYSSCEYEEGEKITPEPAPTKEGYTFSGWSEIPETMPANDVEVTGYFTPIKGLSGDANDDGEIDVADVDFVIERIGEACDETNKAADVNGDGEINVADVDYIIERIK